MNKLVSRILSAIRMTETIQSIVIGCTSCISLVAIVAILSDFSGKVDFHCNPAVGCHLNLDTVQEDPTQIEGGMEQSPHADK